MFRGRAFRGKRLGVFAVAASMTVTTAVPAQTPPVPSASAERARSHFDRARALYTAGAYRDAIQELEAARALDPQGKELVYNLAVLHEKLGELDDALGELRLYEQMDLSPSEREKAEGYEHRLEGARKALTPPHPPASPEPPPEVVVAAPSGRLDAASVVVGGVGLVGLGVGTAFGIKALTDRPTGFVTGKSGSFADFQHLNDVAHGEAIAADVSLGVGVVASVVFAILYFGRAQDAPPAADAKVSISLGHGGGTLLLGGTL